MNILGQSASQWTPAAVVALVGAIASGVVAIIAAIRSGVNASTLVDHQNALTDQSATLADHAQQLSELAEAVLGAGSANSSAGPNAKVTGMSEPVVVKAVLALIGLSALFFGSGLMHGCSTVGSGANPIVMNAERTQQAAFATINAFLSVDNANRATMPASIHAAAEKLRQVYPQADSDLTQAIATYQAASTSANASALDSELQLVLQMATEAQADIVQFESPATKPTSAAPLN